MYTMEQLEVFADMPFLMFVKNEDLTYIWGNKHFLDLAGLGSLDDLIGKNDHQLAWADYAGTLNEIDEGVLDSGKPMNVREQAHIPGRGVVTGSVCKFPAIVDGKRCLLGMSVLLDD